MKYPVGKSLRRFQHSALRCLLNRKQLQKGPCSLCTDTEGIGTEVECVPLLQCGRGRRALKSDSASRPGNAGLRGHGCEGTDSGREMGSCMDI